MENIDTEELLNCYKRIIDYLITLEDKKKEIEKSMENV